ncbi:group I truncated hemoglobin [Streptosporangium lutulentum]|uniref:Hemoglobin n=1 Tax=Streptosporangium lutulentum TaxID=1461250 RepID=A0ABT9QMR1_9ACTN|nr:group 1 truncated hemoglobin [Streptosporangium lutulentum]MDP9847324.1 hemoglobin [Streptosporangium lutulentum]
MADPSSYYESIGGASSVREVVDRFYVAVLDDADLKPYFADVDMPGLKRHMVALLGSVLGGPKPYEGRELADAHRGMGIAGEHYDKVGDLLVTVLRGQGADEEVVRHVVHTLGQVRGAIVEEPTGVAG